MSTPRSERRLIRLKNEQPIGPRRLRAALASSSNIPFSQLPYQCFQEARKILAEDRAEKEDEIKRTREKIGRLQGVVDEAKEKKLVEEGHLSIEELKQKEHRLRSMRHRLEDLKIWADINDPLVKKRFEDGMGKDTQPIPVKSKATN